MAEGKKKVIWYTNWCDTFEKLNDEEAGRLIKHFCEYITDKNPEPPDRITDLLFDPIKDTLKRDLIKWEERQERNRANGSKGGRPRKPTTTESNPKKTNGLNKNPKKGVTDTVTDNVNDNDNVIKKKSKAFAPPSLEQVKEYCKERKNSVNAETFIDFYASKGWLVGKNKMKDWKASIRTWEKRENNGHQKNSGANKTAATGFNNEQETYDY